MNSDSRVAGLRAWLSSGLNRDAVTRPYGRAQYAAAMAANASRQLIVALGVALQARVGVAIDPRAEAVWLTFLTTLAAGMVFELGISAVLVRQLGWDAGAAANAKDVKTDRALYLGAADLINRYAALFTSVVSSIGFFFYARKMFSGPQLQQWTIAMAIGYGVAVAMQMRSYFFQSALAGAGFPLVAVVTRVVILVAMHATSLAAAVMTHRLWVGYLVWPLGGLAEVAIMKRRTSKIVVAVPRLRFKESWAVIGPMIRDGIQIALSGGVMNATVALLPYIVGLTAGPDAVRVYTTAMLAAQGAQTLINQAISFYSGRIAYEVGLESAKSRAAVLERQFLIFSAAVLAAQLMCIPIAAIVGNWMNRGAIHLSWFLYSIAAVMWGMDSVGHAARMLVWCFGRWPFLKYFLAQLALISGFVPIGYRYGVAGILVAAAVNVALITTIPSVLTFFRTAEQPVTQ